MKTTKTIQPIDITPQNIQLLAKRDKIISADESGLAASIGGFGGTPISTINNVIQPDGTINPTTIPAVDRALQMVVFNFINPIVTGDGKFYIHIDQRLDQKYLVDAHAEVITAGITGSTQIQLANINAGVDLFSSKLRIDTGDTGSDTSSVPVSIIVANSQVLLNQVLRIDVDLITTTAPEGLIITLGFSSTSL